MKVNVLGAEMVIGPNESKFLSRIQNTILPVSQSLISRFLSVNDPRITQRPIERPRWPVPRSCPQQPRRTLPRRLVRSQLAPVAFPRQWSAVAVCELDGVAVDHEPRLIDHPRIVIPWAPQLDRDVGRRGHM
jgi:hypothetical protein